jgi:hypothetical protein
MERHPPRSSQRRNVGILPRMRGAKGSIDLASSPVFRGAALLAAFLLMTWNVSAIAGASEGQRGKVEAGIDPSSLADDCESPVQGSPYIPVDSWVYPAVLRLYSLGFADAPFLGIRPWTRSSVRRMLEATGDSLEDAAEDRAPDTNEAQRIYKAVMYELNADPWSPCRLREETFRIESSYSVVRGITGVPLRDSFHLGSTIVNDFGRPYAQGFSNYSGASGYASVGRFTLYARGEFQGTPSGIGYSSALAGELANLDGTSSFFNPTCWLYETSCTPIPYYLQTTIPTGALPAITSGRVIEAYVSAHYLNHEISFGKLDNWLGPGLGGAMAYSNNAENIYCFRIDRTEPLEIPLLSRITGPFRYEFLAGPLEGHVYPKDPWMHVEKISFKPTANLEFGFERTVIWGGKGHEPVTLRSFLRSFVSLTAPDPPVKDSPRDPGARFGAFDFSWRLPFLRRWFTLYADSEVHDEISPISAPRRASMRPGIYLSRLPGIPRLDLRAEAVTTDPSASNGASQFGHFMYWETIQRQGYTNRGQLFGDWIGREDKGGQAWVTYHLSGNEWLQVEIRNQKATTYFIPGGTTLNEITFQAVKRIGKEVEINGTFSFAQWKAPIYPTGTPTYPAAAHSVTTTNVQLTWFPRWRTGH